MEMTAITKVHGPTGTATEIDGYTLITEPPVAAGGSGEYPPATRMAVAAMLNCIFSGFTAFCKKREIPTEGLQMAFNGNIEDGVYDKMNLTLTLPSGFPDKYRDTLARVVETCTVKKIMQNLPEITLDLQ